MNFLLDQSCRCQLRLENQLCASRILSGRECNFDARLLFPAFCGDAVQLMQGGQASLLLFLMNACHLEKEESLTIFYQSLTILIFREYSISFTAPDLKQIKQ